MWNCSCPYFSTLETEACKCFGCAVLRLKLKQPPPGGVTALSEAQIRKINGFPNDFWGWGSEDDEISLRILHHGMAMIRFNPRVVKCVLFRTKQTQTSTTTTVSRFSYSSVGGYELTVPLVVAQVPVHSLSDV